MFNFNLLPMVNKLFIMSALVVSCFVSVAQNVDYNKIIVPGSPSSLSDEEKLVQLAWKNYPGNEIAYRQIEAADAEVNLKRWSWLNNFYAQGNMNEFTLNPEKYPNQSLYWPKYNVGVSLPFGTIMKVSQETRKAKEERGIAEANLDRQKLFVRATVLGMYHDYLSLVEIYKIEKQASDDADDLFKLEEQKFQNGEITLDKYNAAMDNKNVKKIRTITAENNFAQVKLKLEELLGMRLEEALAK